MYMHIYMYNVCIHTFIIHVYTHIYVIGSVGMWASLFTELPATKYTQVVHIRVYISLVLHTYRYMFMYMYIVSLSPQKMRE